MQESAYRFGWSGVEAEDVRPRRHVRLRRRAEHPFIGMWHITGMELWDDDYVSSWPSPSWPRALIRRVRVGNDFRASDQR